MNVYVLIEEVDVIGVFKSYQLAEKSAREWELHNFYIVEKQLRG